jgi:hypothetical protein
MAARHSRAAGSKVLMVFQLAQKGEVVQRALLGALMFLE